MIVRAAWLIESQEAKGRKWRCVLRSGGLRVVPEGAAKSCVEEAFAEFKRLVDSARLTAHPRFRLVIEIELPAPSYAVGRIVAAVYPGSWE